jgi:hypothetical protein
MIGNCKKFCLPTQGRRSFPAGIRCRTSPPSTTTVEIFHQGVRVASHARSWVPYQATDVHEDIDFRTARGRDRQLVRSLVAESAWVREHQNLFLLGPTGISKTWMARADGSLPKLLYRLGRVDVLIVDDWAMAPLADGECREFLEICG